MEKTIMVDGMTCDHCKARVEKVLNQIDGVTAVVNLDKKLVDVKLTKDIADEVLKSTIEEAGYDVKGFK